MEISGPSTAAGRTATFIREPSANRALRFVHVPAHRGDDFVYDAKKVRFVLEGGRGGHKPPVPFYVNMPVRVDQNVADRRVLEQGFDWPKPCELIGELAGESLKLTAAKMHVRGAHIFGHDLLNQAPELLLGHALRGCEVQIVDKFAMQPDFGIG
jgi:hypothetical protein